MKLGPHRDTFITRLGEMKTIPGRVFLVVVQFFALPIATMSNRLLRAKRGAHASLRVPHGKNSYLVPEGDIVHVIASFLEQKPTGIRYRGLPI